MTDRELLEAMYSDMHEVKQHVSNIEERVSSIEERVSNIEEHVSNLEKSNTAIKLILENEIRVNIQRVAEGHLDLSRNLHDAMKPSNEIEMLAIKVRTLESDVRELKQKFLVAV